LGEVSYAGMAAEPQPVYPVLGAENMIHVGGTSIAQRKCKLAIQKLLDESQTSAEVSQEQHNIPVKASTYTAARKATQYLRAQLLNKNDRDA